MTRREALQTFGFALLGSTMFADNGLALRTLCQSLPCGEVNPPQFADGTLVRGLSGTNVFLMIGGAKFLVPTIDELFALGYQPHDVLVVPDRTLELVDDLPSDGTVLRERLDTARYVISGSRAILVPTQAAADALGLSQQRVGILPVGGLRQLVTYALPSASKTPASMFYRMPPPNWRQRTEVPGVDLPNGNHVVELRGWLTGADPEANKDDCDWIFGLEVDPEWLDQHQIDPATFVKVGDILMMGSDPSSADHRALAATPGIHIELNGLLEGSKPADWTAIPPNRSECTGRLYPYDPLYAPTNPVQRFQAGQYVRISGCLITDISHAHEKGGGFDDWTETLLAADKADYKAAARDWQYPLDEHDPHDPSRWTEIHPPDLIEILSPQKVQAVKLRAIALVARTGRYNITSIDREISVCLTPPRPRPIHQRIAIQEYVGPETVKESIVEGNSARTGADIQITLDCAIVHVKVRALPYGLRAGKFKAVYKLWWVPNPGPWGMTVAVSQPAVSTWVVKAWDTDTQQPLQGVVTINGVPVGTTDVPFPYKLRRRRRRRDGEDFEPQFVPVTVISPNYLPGGTQLYL